MSGQIRQLTTADSRVARVQLSHPGKHNAISVAMWRALRACFEQLQALPIDEAPRAVIVSGEGGQFAAGADIAEFPSFRFQPDTLRAYHEDVIAPALAAVLACDIPIVAEIEGACVGGGLEIAACCDLRIASPSARFGAPIAKLGFPMAPGELQVLRRVVPAATLREVLLEARLLDAPTALQRGLVHRLADDAPAQAWATALRVAALSPQAARRNKQCLRLIESAGESEALTPAQRAAQFDYAGHHEHREGIAAFLAKRPPVF